MAAIVVTYTHPVAGLTPPTAFQAKTLVVATLGVTADGDVTATVIHNFGLSTAELAAGLPITIVTQTTSQALTALSAWSVAQTDGNTTTLTKLASAGSAGAAQCVVSIERPHTLMK